MTHNFRGYKSGDTVTVEGSYDINIWYSCQDDTKTEVVRQTDTYKEVVTVPRKNDTDNSSSEEIIVRSLKQPSCVKVDIKDGKIFYTVEKELGIEIVGDTKVKIAIDEDEDEWDVIDDEPDLEEVDKQIDEEVKEEFLD